MRTLALNLTPLATGAMKDLPDTETEPGHSRSSRQRPESNAFE
jgi:hypothetical protein